MLCLFMRPMPSWDPDSAGWVGSQAKGALILDPENRIRVRTTYSIAVKTTIYIPIRPYGNPAKKTHTVVLNIQGPSGKT